MFAQAHSPAGPDSAASILEWLNRNPLPPHIRPSHDVIEATIAEERAAWD